MIAEADRRALVAPTLMAIVLTLGMLAFRTRLGPALAMRPLDVLEPAAAQPAGQAHALLHVLTAMPVIERFIVRRIDVDPDRQRCLQEKALKVMRVKVSFTPASVWILLVTK